MPDKKEACVIYFRSKNLDEWILEIKSSTNSSEKLFVIYLQIENFS